MMANIFIFIGLLCIVYYIGICVYTARLNTTFSGFWILLGTFLIGIGIGITHLPSWAGYVIVGVFCVPLFIFFILMILIVSSMLTLPPNKLPYIIILGAQVRGTKITDSLKRRLDKGLTYLQENMDTEVIVSGGQGRGEEVSEAFAMKEYLVSKGVEENRIILESESTNTYQNLAYSKELVGEKVKVGVVTNNFHIYRAVKIGRSLDYKKIYGISASCKAILFLNYLVREVFAVIQMRFFSCQPILKMS